MPTALAEAVIRDRYQGKQKRELLEEDIEQSVIECVAIYDRAVGAKFDPACQVVDLVRLADLASALRSLNVSLIKKP